MPILLTSLCVCILARLRSRLMTLLGIDREARECLVIVSLRRVPVFIVNCDKNYLNLTDLFDMSKIIDFFFSQSQR